MFVNNDEFLYNTVILFGSLKKSVGIIEAFIKEMFQNSLDEEEQHNKTYFSPFSLFQHYSEENNNRQESINYRFGG